MNTGKIHYGLICRALAVCVPLCLSGCTGPQVAPEKQAQGMTVEELVKMPKIDAHAHIMEIAGTGDKLFAAFLEKHNIKWLDICTFELNAERFPRQVALAEIYHQRLPQRFSWATSFSLDNWGSAGWTGSSLAAIQDGFDKGAVAVKVWKDIGMVLKDPDSSFVMIDDPRFDPILDYIQARGKTLVGHIGEPLNCWLPLDSMTVDGDRSYFKEFPQYHAYLHPEIPRFWTLIDSRDRMLGKHPGLRMVGCHLGSLEFDVDQLAARFDKYPNLAVDLASRICHLQVQDREKVRRFLIKYQDRVLYGTDFVIETADTDSLKEQLTRFDQVYLLDCRYFATDEEIEAQDVRKGLKVRGLALPAPVLKKIYYENAVKWYPGI